MAAAEWSIRFTTLVAPVALKHARLTANSVLVSFGALSPTEGTLGLCNSVSRHQVAGFKCRMATLKRTQQRPVAGRQRRAFFVKHRPDSDRCAHSRPGWVPRSPRGSAWVFHGARLMQRCPPSSIVLKTKTSSHFYILSPARDESFIKIILAFRRQYHAPHGTRDSASVRSFFIARE
jgi:hypothetical protein